MDFRTKIDVPPLSFDFSYADKITLLGSCFAENIGKRLANDKFSVDVNPFGVLYNPASVASALRFLLSPERLGEEDLFEHEGVYHSFFHHSRFSSTSPEDGLKGMNERLAFSSEWLYQASRLVITFGTASVYRLKSTGEIVSNCHKLPERMFERSRLSVSEIVEEWRALLLSVWEHIPRLKVMFTVSPVRHWKDGAHANQLNKSILLLAIDELQKEFPEQISYFPAYEIVMDELRDYRFYNEDMIHPSPVAINYIWECFVEKVLSTEAKETRKEWEALKKAIEHKPFHPDSNSYQSFLRQTLLKVEQFHSKTPTFDVTEEIESLRSGLK